ncbi:NAD(P)-dependent alcohol dehydrogenase [Phanerochaete sordida]|uniref:NAD(P)-dependent alcohol dehydrogenase n=1 Tax=Phanerochaete sordida TaxID=48140 RepID=A0A9P3G0S2_9APHY|nr:NAD(P)-dependent alcohol dehydrogenase [Phanerochaete sordida]
MAAPAVPDTQKAWVITRRGVPAQAVHLDTKFPVSKKLAKGEVLVRVQAAAFNPVGYKMMGLLPNFVARRPHVAEHDFAGVVVDANGSGLKEGHEVYGWIPLPLKLSTKQGALCEYVRVPAQLVIPTPPGVKTTEAAGLGLAGMTAYHALFATTRLEPGQHLFVNGGSTAVGMLAIQMAKALGCTVGASASGKKEGFLRGLGVDRFVDYTQGPVYEQLAKDPPSPKYHVLLEAVGTADPLVYTRSEAYLAPGGVFLSVGPQPGVGGGFGGFARLMVALMTPKVLGGTKAQWKLISVDDRRSELEEFGRYIEDGRVKSVVDSVFAFEDVLKAYERVMEGRSTGKVVVKVDPSVE